MVKSYNLYSTKTNTLTDENGKFEMNDASSEKVNHRAKCISVKRDLIKKEES